MDVNTVVEIARRTLLDKRMVATSRLEEALGYDSLTHLQLVLELEKHSGMKLTGDLAETDTLEQVNARFLQG
jgi:acyl carrier protein